MIKLMLFFTMIKYTMRTLIFIILVLSYSFLQAQRPTNYSFIVNTEQGFIDYANRIVVCRGTADIIGKESIDNSLSVVEKNIKIAKAEARTNARTNLIELMK